MSGDMNFLNYVVSMNQLNVTYGYQFRDLI
jgi:hypothetical protein